MSEEQVLGKSPRGGYVPETPIQILSPIYQWPPKPKAVFKWLAGFPGYFLPYQLLSASIALISWLYLTPDIAEMKDLSLGPIAAIFFRNLVVLSAWTSIWHVRLYSKKAQGTDYKYNSKWLAENNSKFLFSNQFKDNVFWTLCSAVPIWTAYEVASYWLHANEYVSSVSWQSQPIYCTALLFIALPWGQVHFHLTHRAIHWDPLYRTVHSLHHHNTNFGPWSGLAMHPVEHLIYFSGVVLFWIIPSHPLHATYMLFAFALGPAPQHAGFAKIVFGGKSLENDHYMHYLHHKYFEVNYGNGGLAPLDKWLDTFHDGSNESQKAMMERMRRQQIKR